MDVENNLRPVEGNPTVNNLTDQEHVLSRRRFLGALAASAGVALGTYAANRLLIPSSAQASSSVIRNIERSASEESVSLAWREVLSTAPIRQKHAAGITSNGEIYVTAGSFTSQLLRNIDRFNKQTASYETVAFLSRGIAGHSVAVKGDILYILGGVISADDVPWVTSNRVFAYNPLTNSVGEARNMIYPRYALAAISSRDGNIYMAGGSNSRGHLKSVESYNPVNNTGEELPPMNYARSFLAGAEDIYGRLVFAGGAIDNGVVINTVEVFDRGRWEIGRPMNRERGGFLLFPWGRKLIAIGGGKSASERYKDWEEYDPDTDTWTLHSSQSELLNWPRVYYAGVVDNSDVNAPKIYLFEGETLGKMDGLGSVERGMESLPTPTATSSPTETSTPMPSRTPVPATATVTETVVSTPTPTQATPTPDAIIYQTPTPPTSPRLYLPVTAK